MTLFDTIQKETEEAIDRGFVNSHEDWRRETIENLKRFCLHTENFTMNDFREFNQEVCKFTTHDNRAMGGVIATGRKEKWIAPTGKSIVSRVGHKSPLIVWKSLIYKPTQ